MLLVHIYIREHRFFNNVNIPLNGSFACHVDDGVITLNKKDDTSQFYHNHYCSALVGPNGTGKSTVLDFIELLVIPDAASGLAIFYDEPSDCFHLCLKNLPDYHHAIVVPAVNYRINKDPGRFIRENNIHFVKINNISADLDVLSLTSRRTHKNIYNCSRQGVSNSISQKSDYFSRIFAYFKSPDGMARYIESVYYEIVFKSSPRYLVDNILSSPMPEECSAILTSWKNNHTPVVLRSEVIEQGKSAVFQRLLEMNLISILSALCNIDGGKDTVLPLLLYRYIMLDNVSPGTANTKLKLEIVISPDDRFQISPVLRSSLNIVKMIEGHDSMTMMQTFLTSDDVKAKFQEIVDAFEQIAQNIEDFSGGFSEDADNHFRLNDFFGVEKTVNAIQMLDRDIATNFKCGWRGISSGEFARLHIFSESYNYLSRQNNKVNSIYLLDEIDLYLHPEWQRTFLSDFLYHLRTIEAPSGVGKPQIILTTHSPVIISDFISDDIVALRRMDDDEYSPDYDEIIIDKSLGFGNPIADVYMDGMHLKSTFGELSRQKIASLIEQAEEGGAWSEYDRLLIDKIDNTNFKNYLKNHAKNKQEI